MQMQSESKAFKITAVTSGIMLGLSLLLYRLGGEIGVPFSAFFLGLGMVLFIWAWSMPRPEALTEDGTASRWTKGVIKGAFLLLVFVGAMAFYYGVRL